MRWTLRKTVLLVALLGAVVALGIAGAYLYRYVTRPTLAKLGGTILVYELDRDQERPPSYRAEDMAAALRRRLDPWHVNGVTVQPIGDNRFEIGIPRVGRHSEEVDRIKTLLATAGMLEFRVLANKRDDRAAIEAAQRYLESRSDRRDLEDEARRGQPPPAPRNSENGLSFPWSNEWDRGEATYRWVELSRYERSSLNLYNDAENDAARNSFWKEVAQARQNGKTVVVPQLGDALLWSRACSNRALSEEERQRKRFEYFVLTRVPNLDERVTGHYVEKVSEAKDSRASPAVAIRFNSEGGDRFWKLTSANRPSATPDETFRRRVGIILDGQLISAPHLNGPFRHDVLITGIFTAQEVDQLVRLLDAGALPAVLKPIPVRETTVEPRK